MTRNPKSTIGITLLELIVASSLLTLIVLAGGGIYISGWNMFRDAQFTSQAHRNALLPMAHMVKHLQEAASEFNASGTSLDFMQYGTPPTITSRYFFDAGPNRIIYYPDITAPGLIIGTNIQSCTFTERHSDTDGIIVVIDITATDSRGQNSYQLLSKVTARYTATPAIYEPPPPP